MQPLCVCTFLVLGLRTPSLTFKKKPRCICDHLFLFSWGVLFYFSKCCTSDCYHASFELLRSACFDTAEKVTEEIWVFAFLYNIPSKDSGMSFTVLPISQVLTCQIVPFFLLKKAMVETVVSQKVILEVRRKKMTLKKREVRRTRKKVKMKN